MTRPWYRLTLEGELGELAREAFGGAPVTVEDGHTVVMVRDQAELFGVVQRVSDLGLTMLSAARVEVPTDPPR